MNATQKEEIARLTRELDHFDVTYDVETDRWITRENLNVHDSRLGVSFTVPEGFQYNLASIPRPALWLIERHALGLRSTAVHDFLYEKKGLIWARTLESRGLLVPFQYSRRNSDKFFNVLMADEGVSFLKRRVAYYAVRLGGWTAW